jgi:hypothetical protein
MCSAISDSVRYGLPNVQEQHVDTPLFAFGLVMHGVTTFLLTVAFAHQLRFRSITGSPNALCAVFFTACIVYIYVRVRA